MRRKLKSFLLAEFYFSLFYQKFISLSNTLIKIQTIIDVKSQERNRKNNIFITYKNETHCIGEWAEILGINYITLHQRIRKYNWSIERAFTEPINTKG